MKKLLIILFIFQIQIFSAQVPLFVSAKNGLIVRNAPDKSADRIGKLNYAEEIISFKNTNRPEEIVDDGVIINGNWYYITANEVSGKVIEGYVFSGFLTSKKLKKNIVLKFENFNAEFEHIDLWDSEKTLAEIQKDTVKLNSSLTGSPENKRLKIKSPNFKKIEVYQRFQNSVTIMNEGPHCDLTNWKHHYSQWKKITATNTNEFQMLAYSEDDRSQFIPIETEELKNVVKEHCGEQWANLITDIESVNQYPSAVGISKISIKIVITDKNGSVSENIIEFTIPMGC